MTETSDSTVTETSDSSLAQESWLEALPESFRDAPFIKAAKSPEDAVSAIQNAASYMGNSIRIPSEEAGEEDRAAFVNKIIEKAPNLMVKPDVTDERAMMEHFRSIGMPEKPDQYSYNPPEGKEIPPDLESFAATAHKHGLTQTQFEGVINDLLGTQWESAEILEAEHAEEIDALRKEWGAAYDDRMKTVENFLKLTDAPEGILGMFKENAMSAAEIRWIQDIASQTKSAVELAEHDSQQQAAMTPEEAANQIQEMINNPEHPYWKPTDPRHGQAIKRMLELQEMANPDALVGDAALMSMRS